MSIFPVFLFSLLHATTYTKKVLDVSPPPQTAATATVTATTSTTAKTTTTTATSAL